MQVILARPLSESVVWPRWLAHDKEDEGYQLQSGHHILLDWGKWTGFWMYLSLFMVLLELTVIVIFCLFILSNLPEVTLLIYSSLCLPLQIFYGSNPVLLAILSSHLQFCPSFSQYAHWYSLASMPPTLTIFLTLLLLFLLVLSDTYVYLPTRMLLLQISTPIDPITI